MSIEGVATIIFAMDEPSTGKKREIVKLIFPDLRYGGDPDIERYFELRKAGKLAHALAIYNGALRTRYPDDTARILLLKLFRENDPRYSAYQDSLLLAFAESLSVKIRLNIDLIVAPLEKADLSDALRALKAVESVLSRLPGETEDALGLLYRYESFAGVLGYRAVLIKRALDLVREYDAVSRADSPSDYDFIARSAAIEERRRASLRRSGAVAHLAPAASAAEENYDFVSRSAGLERGRRSIGALTRKYFDPDRIKFSEADKARVEISLSLTRREDKVLAFCAKYWSRATDAAFERVVFLYSRKFGGRHFEVFRTIKLGRARGATDDEVLSAVAAILTTSYSYSVSGDLYMQIIWKHIRSRMDARAVAERLAVPGPEPRFRSNGTADDAETARRTKVRSQPVRVEQRVPAPTDHPPKSGRKAPASQTLAAQAHASRHTPMIEELRRPSIDKKAARGTKLPAVIAASHESASLRPANNLKGVRLLARPPAGSDPIHVIRAKGGSISDSIRKLSGRSYDVYKEIFLVKVRGHIHRRLLASQTKSHGFFDTAANDAEDQVFGFITAHYDDPFMDWEHSAEREAVESLGFSMPSLAPIIESCFKKL